MSQKDVGKRLPKGQAEGPMSSEDVCKSGAVSLMIRLAASSTVTYNSKAVRACRAEPRDNEGAQMGH